MTHLINMKINGKLFSHETIFNNEFISEFIKVSEISSVIRCECSILIYYFDNNFNMLAIDKNLETMEIGNIRYYVRDNDR